MTFDANVDPIKLSFIGRFDWKLFIHKEDFMSILCVFYAYSLYKNLTRLYYFFTGYAYIQTKEFF